MAKISIELDVPQIEFESPFFVKVARIATLLEEAVAWARDSDDEITYDGTLHLVWPSPEEMANYPTVRGAQPFPRPHTHNPIRVEANPDPQPGEALLTLEEPTA
jgi:hypothetical protein